MLNNNKKEDLCKLAEKLARTGDLIKALSVCRDLNVNFPDYAFGMFTISQVYRANSDHVRSFEYIEKAIFLEKENPRWCMERAFCLLSLNEVQLAKKEALKLLEKSEESLAFKTSMGLLLAHLNMHQESKEQYVKAINLKPDYGVLYYNLATAQRFLGELDEAEANMTKSVELDPDNYEAQYTRSGIRRQTLESNNIQSLKSTLEGKNLPPVGEVYLNFGLAKELDDLGEYKQSFSILSKGTRIRRDHMKYDLDSDLGIIAAIKKSYSERIFDNHINGSEDPAPIFILGMPRTGTTLVERILESHSSVKSAGELNNFAIEMMKLVKSSGLSPTSRLDLIDKTTQLNFKQLGDAYIKSVEPLRDGSPRFIDKLPFNYLYVGLIHLAMPNAKIINLQRHPMDTCYSVYKQLFKDAYPFSYDLKELGQYYVAYRELMAHWNKVLPGVIHTVNYEDVVADTEGEARRLLEYCDLPWEDQCLRFYENKSASTTASATQVRQKVYSSSVGKWRQYEEQLQPLADILTKAGIDIS